MAEWLMYLSAKTVVQVLSPAVAEWLVYLSAKTNGLQSPAVTGLFLSDSYSSGVDPASSKWAPDIRLGW